MVKLRHLLGLPVVETDTGTQIGEVEEIVVDIDAAVMCGLIINEDHWFKGKGIISFKDLFSLGRDAVMVRNCHVVQQISELNIANNHYYLHDLFDKEIVTDSGLRLGVLTDIILNGVTGELLSYQLSDSIITDLLYGRLMMPLPQVQMVGKDKVIVPEGMRKLLNDTKELEEIQ